MSGGRAPRGQSAAALGEAATGHARVFAVRETLLLARPEKHPASC